MHALFTIKLGCLLRVNVIFFLRLGHITTVPAFNNGTFTNVPTHRETRA